MWIPSDVRRPNTMLPALIAAMLLSRATAQAGGVGPGSSEPASPFELQVAASMEQQRDDYYAQIDEALGAVARWFSDAGYAVSKAELVRTAVVFDDIEKARDAVARHFGVDPSAVPDSFSGTVDSATLFLVSREIYRNTYERLYPEWPWVDEDYRGLIVHEIAHQAHSRIALSRFGSEEAMGPRWFFEGLAILCAGNFLTSETAVSRLSWDQFMAYVEKDAHESLSYPIYGRMIRSLTVSFPVGYLIDHARDKDFPASLREGYVRSELPAK